MDICLFGTPEIRQGRETIHFPFRKAEALLYYLLVKQRASRDELTGLFWSELPDDTAKKNLRNAIYQIKKVVGPGIFKTVTRSEVVVNMGQVRSIDYHRFHNNQDLDAYQGAFLEGFHVKNAQGFEDWLLETREFSKIIFIDLGQHETKTLLDHGQSKDALTMARRITQADPFDEGSYLLLMESWVACGKPHKAIEAYKELETVLEDELGVEPDGKTKEFYQTIMTPRAEPSADFFFGRRPELDALVAKFQRFKAGSAQTGTLLEGEAGIGKTSLLEQFHLQAGGDQAPIVTISCYQAESGFYLKPWNALLNKLKPIIQEYKVPIPSQWMSALAYLFPSFQSEVESTGAMTYGNPIEQHRIEEMLTVILQNIFAARPTVVVFEDLQWMDTLSMNLLAGVLLRLNRHHVHFIGTMRRSGYQEVRKLKSTLLRNGIAETINLSRFTEQELNDYLQLMTDKNVDVKQMYQVTEGNPLFVKEWIQSAKNGQSMEMTPGMVSVFENRYQEASLEAQKMMDIAACFSDRIDFEAMKSITGRSDLDLLEWIEELQEKNILRESKDKHIRYTFTHQKLRDFVYDRMRPNKRKILHRKIAMWYESGNHRKRPVQQLEMLMHHWNAASEPVKSIQYRLQYSELFLANEHELYPVIDSGGDQGLQQVIGRKHVLKWFEDFENQLRHLESEGWMRHELNMPYLQLYLMQGRYWIQDGQYEKGRQVIASMLQLAEGTDLHRFILRGHRQLINLGVQLHDTDLMATYIGKSKDILKVHVDPEEEALLARLSGLQLLMAGAYEEADAQLHNALQLFKQLDMGAKNYSLNIAACNNYLGDLHRSKGNLEHGLGYYDKAIEIASISPSKGAGAVFATNAAQTAYELGYSDRAIQYLRSAIEGYRSTRTNWKRSVAESYIGLIQLERGRLPEGLAHLQAAYEFSNRLKSPYELGVFHRVLASGLQYVQGVSSLEFPVYSVEDHIRKAHTYFQQSGAVFELQCLQALHNGYILNQ